MAAAPATPSAAGMAATVDLHNSSLGPISSMLKEKNAVSVRADKNGKSACSGPCATAWPPLLSNRRAAGCHGCKR
jgi:predicted lipoprotein with Yx(FWY)xxD motif